MGLFNFLYKLTNIFSNKRKLKVFIILAIILFILFAWSRGVFASTPEDDNQIMAYQLVLQENLVYYLASMKTNPTVGFDNNAYNAILYYMANFQIYVTVPTGDPNTDFWIYFYVPTANGNSTQIFTVTGSYSIGLNSGTEIPCMLGEITASRFARVPHAYGSRVTPVYSNNQTSVYMPSACYMVRSTYVNDFLQSQGYLSSFNSTYSTNDEQLQLITSQGFTSINSSIQNQTNQMTNSINSATNSITNSVDNLTNTIEDTTTDDTQVEFAQDNNQDITSGFFTGLYDSFETAFVDTDYKFVSFPIPFTEKVITFSSSYVLNNIKRNEKFSVLVTLAESFWWFALGYFVILDIYKKINAIKSGDLTNIENDNITTDLL